MTPGDASGDLGEIIVVAPHDLPEVIVRAPQDLGDVRVNVRPLPATRYLAEIVVTAPRVGGYGAVAAMASAR